MQSSPPTWAVNHYEILGLPTPENALAGNKVEQTALSKAYRKLSLKYHPDKNQSENKEMAREMFELVKEAYDILKDDTKRNVYLVEELFAQQQHAMEVDDKMSMMTAAAKEAEERLQRQEQVAAAALGSGGSLGDANQASIFAGEATSKELFELYNDSAKAIEDEMLKMWEVEEWATLASKEADVLSLLKKRPRM